MPKDNYKEKMKSCQGDSDKLLELELSDRFGKQKSYNEVLVKSYDRIYSDQWGDIDEKHARKIKRVSECGTHLQFRKPLSDSSAKWTLYDANFCRERLCPMCSWRRSLKIYSHVSKIMDYIQDDYIFLFLTLTVPNCTALELNDAINDLMLAFKKFMKYKKVKSAVCGYFRALEITHNTDELYHVWKTSRNGKRYKALARDPEGNTYPNPNYDTYHPHFHNILAVKKSYFKNKDLYIHQSEWLDMWRKATKNLNITQVDIRRCKPKDLELGQNCVDDLKNIDIINAVCEVSKYSVKGSDFLYKDNDELTDRAVSTLSSALYHRRLCEFGGCFEEAYKLLNLDNPEESDLIVVDGSELRSDVGFMIRYYNWGCGAYKLDKELIYKEENKNEND